MSASTSILPTPVSIDYSHYMMSSETQVTAERKGGRMMGWTILTYTDGSEWLVLQNKHKERFCGFLYLQNALERAGLNTIQAAPNKLALYQGKVVCLSQYCGEEKPGIFAHMSELSDLTSKTGFNDVMGSANLRKKEGVIYVFDTEKSSFDKSVHEEIDAFSEQWDSIWSYFIETLNCS